jgi:acyl carrier protein
MNQTKLLQCFAESLGLESSAINDQLSYGTIAEWDSRAHMALVAEIETAFDLMLDTDDIIAMSSFGETKSILAKYGVEF